MIDYICYMTDYICYITLLIFSWYYVCLQLLITLFDWYYITFDYNHWLYYLIDIVLYLNIILDCNI